MVKLTLLVLLLIWLLFVGIVCVAMPDFVSEDLHNRRHFKQSKPIPPMAIQVFGMFTTALLIMVLFIITKNPDWTH